MGLASRRAFVGSVVLTNYAVGLVLLVALALIWQESFPAPTDALWGGLAGVAGMLGLLSFYSALSRGKMGIAAPVSAVLTAAPPVLFGMFTAGLPTPLQLGGFALALPAIGLIAGPRRAEGKPTQNHMDIDDSLSLDKTGAYEQAKSASQAEWPLVLVQQT